MATLGPESARAALAQLGSAPSLQARGCAKLPPSRGLERALEEAAASGVLSLSCRKLKEFPRTAAEHDLSDTVEAGRCSPRPANPFRTKAEGKSRAWVLRPLRPSCQRLAVQCTRRRTVQVGAST